MLAATKQKGANMFSLKRVFCCLALCALALLATAPDGQAKDNGKGKDSHYAGGKGKPDKDYHDGKGKPDKDYNDGKGGRGDRDDDFGGLVRAGISIVDARHLAEGCRMTGYKSLPPGIQKNLARGKPLPPGIAKKMVPHNMLGRLPAHPGYEWRVAGMDLILVSGAGVVADILAGVFR